MRQARPSRTPALLLATLLPPLLLGACTHLASTPQAHPDVLPIGAVQGRAAHSPLLGQAVVVEGVLSADLAEGLGGWFVQDAGDGDPTTSDALFVRVDGASIERAGKAASATVGDRLRIHGEVAETGAAGHGPDTRLTTLLASRIEVIGRGSVASVVLDAPPADWEALEGMRVRIQAPLTVSGRHELDKRGVLVAAFGGRLYTPTEIALPGAAAQAVARDNARRQLLIDDASDKTPTGWQLAGVEALRTGSVITLAEGVIDQRWGQYRLQPTAPLQLQPAPRPQPPTVPGDVRLAAFNLENLFNGDGRGGGFPTPRGARTQAQWEAQLARLVATIRGLAPDVAALMELENDGDGPLSAIAQLVDALNADGGDWRFVETGERLGSDAIRVGMLYRASRVRPVGKSASFAAGPIGTLSREPLAQAFVPVSGGRDDGPTFVVVANHFKSKGCGKAEGDNRDQGDGQGCWNPVRVESARLLVDWLATDPTGTGSDLIAIVGDFNAYAMEDPIRTIVAAGYRDARVDTSTPVYSYVYDGQAGRLDHALLSPALAGRLVASEKWHINADEGQNVGHRGGNAVEPGAPWRSSDHDPLILGLQLRGH